MSHIIHEHEDIQKIITISLLIGKHDQI